MTISSETRLIRYTGNGATTVFPYTFYIPDADSVEVSVVTIADGTTVVIDAADYTISGLGETTFGSVTYPLVGSPLSSAYYLIIKRVVAYAQNLDVTGQSRYDPSLLEEQLDLIVMQTQQLAEEQSRNLVGQAGESFANTLPPKATLANRLLGFDASGEPEAKSFSSGTFSVPVASVDDELVAWSGVTADTFQSTGFSFRKLPIDVAAAGVGGTADAITLTDTRFPDAVTNLTRAIFLPESNNTGAVTVTISDGTSPWAAKDLVDAAGAALAAGVLVTGVPVEIIYSSVADECYLLGQPDLSAYASTATKQEWSKAQRAAVETPTFSATYTPDLSAAPIKDMTLTGNITSLGLPTNCNLHDPFQLIFRQDGTGGRTIAVASGWIDEPVWTTVASEVDIVDCQVVAVSGTTATKVLMTHRYSGAL